MDLAEKNRLDFQRKTEELTGKIAIGSGELRAFSYLAVLLTDFHKHSAMKGFKREIHEKVFGLPDGGGFGSDDFRGEGRGGKHAHSFDSRRRGFVCGFGG